MKWLMMNRLKCLYIFLFLSLLPLSSNASTDATSTNQLADNYLDKFEEVANSRDQTDNELRIGLTYLIKSAELGNPNAQNYLGYFYRSGLGGLTKDYQKAMMWFLKAAEHNSPIAQTRIGDMYYKGEGVEKNLDQAIKWHMKSASQHSSSLGVLEKHASAFSLFFLAMLYEHGDGVEQDNYKAFKLLHKSANLGYIPAQFNVAFRYKYGKGVEQDFLKAYDWYMKIAEFNIPTDQYIPVEITDYIGPAKYSIGFLYQNGEGVKKDLERAQYWFDESCLSGYTPGCLVNIF